MAFEETPIKIKEKSKKNMKVPRNGQASQEAVSEARRCLSRVLDNVGLHIAAMMAGRVQVKPVLGGATLEA